MFVNDLNVAIFDVFPTLSDTMRIMRAANRVLQMINSRITSMHETKNVMTIGSGGASGLSGFSYNSTTKTLTLGNSLKKIYKLYVENEIYTPMSRMYVDDHDDERVYVVEGNKTIRFNKNNSEFAQPVGLDSVTIAIDGLYSIPLIIESDTEIDISEHWENGFICGTIAMLSGSGEFKDETLYKTNKTELYTMLSDIEKWVLEFAPTEGISKFYNYNEPNKSL